MAQVSVPCVGRPLKYPGGWGSANKRIYLSESVYQRWRTLRVSLNFRSDNEVAEYYHSSQDSSTHGESKYCFIFISTLLLIDSNFSVSTPQRLQPGTPIYCSTPHSMPTRSHSRKRLRNDFGSEERYNTLACTY